MKSVASIICVTLFAVLVGACPGPRKPPPGPKVPREPLQPSLDAFQKAWNEQGRTEITSFMASDLRLRKSRLLGKLFRRREWEDKRPPITFERKESVVAHQVAVFWTIEGEEKVMQTDWQWEEGAWFLLDLKLRIRR